MKKILKRLGVLSIMAFIIPFINVNATTASCEDGEVHLQNYLFLDVNVPDSFSVYETDGYSTYGNFPYTFPEATDKQTVKVTKVTENYITSSREMQMYWGLYQTVLNYSDTLGIANFFEDKNNQGGRVFVSEVNPNYTTDTLILHKTWGEWNTNRLEMSTWPAFGKDNIPKHLQDAGNNFANNMKVSVDGATYTSGFGKLTNSVAGSGNNYTSLANYFNDMINGKIVDNTKWYDKTTKINYIPLVVNRKINNNAFNTDGIIFGAKDTSVSPSKYQIFTNEQIDGKELNDTISNTNEVKNSYTAFKNYLSIEKAHPDGVTPEDIIEHNEKETDKSKHVYVYYINDDNADEIDFLRYENYYWPFVLNVEYEVCPVKAETPVVPETKWKLKYDADVADITTVTNMPKDQTDITTEETTIDSLKPERSNWTFKQWCTEKAGKGSCYNPGDKIKSSDKKDITLYAYWVDTKTVENPKQGVVSYIIGFAAVAIIAGGIFLVSKKKNAFKQI